MTASAGGARSLVTMHSLSQREITCQPTALQQVLLAEQQNLEVEVEVVSRAVGKRQLVVAAGQVLQLQLPSSRSPL